MFRNAMPRYEILSEDELIEGLSFPVYRRVSTFIMAPAGIGRILIARGRDAADVPLTHTFGPSTLSEFRVWADEAQ